MKRLALLLLVLTMVLTACSSAEKKGSKKSSNGVIFQYEDIVGDDNGDGEYTYPTSNVMSEGAFDLDRFSIVEDGDDYVFTFEVLAQIKNDFGTGDDWDIQLFDVYFNFGEGKYNHTIAGRHVKINGGWDRGLTVTPKGPMTSKYELKKSIVNSADDVNPAENFVSDIMIPDSKEVEGKKIIARISKAKMGDLSKAKSIQVFSSGFEGIPKSENALIRDVKEYESAWRFGGGSDYDGDPNVIDILGDNSKLGDYKSYEGIKVYPYIDMIEIK